MVQLKVPSQPTEALVENCLSLTIPGIDSAERTADGFVFSRVTEVYHVCEHTLQVGVVLRSRVLSQIDALAIADRALPAAITAASSIWTITYSSGRQSLLSELLPYSQGIGCRSSGKLGLLFW